MFACFPFLFMQIRDLNISVSTRLQAIKNFPVTHDDFDKKCKYSTMLDVGQHLDTSLIFVLHIFTF